MNVFDDKDDLVNIEQNFETVFLSVSQGSPAKSQI